MVSFWQLVLVFAIVLILFGAGKIPVIMRDLGVGLRAFKKGIEDTPEDDNSKKDDYNYTNMSSAVLNKSSKKKAASSNEKRKNIKKKSSALAKKNVAKKNIKSETQKKGNKDN